MGDVISISRVSDIDVFAEFDAQCPAIPDDLDHRIPRSAKKAVDQPQATIAQKNFRNHCIGVVLVSLLVLATVKMVTSAISSRFDLLSTDTADTSHRQTQAAWLAYIDALENNPLYRQLLEEKRLYMQHYPD